MANNTIKTQDYRTRLGLIILLAFVFITVSQTVFAQSVQPMVFELEPIGNSSGEALRISNPNSKPMTVEITAMTLTLDAEGKEVNTPADDDFLIYPPQTIIPADSTQVVKVKYVGDPTIESSLAYRVVVTQLPVNLEPEEGSKVSVLSRFLTLVNVAPKKSEAELNVSNITAQDEENWLITVENTGNKFSRLTETNWEISNSVDTKQKKLKLNSTEVTEIASRSLILPNSKLRFSIKAIEGFSPETAIITIDNG